MRDRDFYSVERRDGEKVVRYRGFAWQTGSGEDADCRIIQCVHEGDPIEVVVAEPNRIDWAVRTNADFGKWIADVTESEARRIFDVFFDGKPGARLPLTELALDTPCGNYWCEG